MKQHKNTKIVCTLGPSTNSVSTICKLIRAGMNIARLNFSHGDHNEQGQIIKNIHQAEKITGQKIAVMQDLQGPKIRLGSLPTEGVFIKKNEIIIFNCDIKYRFIKNLIGLINIPITYAKLYKDLKKGDHILIEDGKYLFSVTKISGKKIFVKSHQVVTLQSHKGLNSPTASISLSPLTPKDIADLKFGLKNHVDFVALSFVRKASDINDLKELITAQKNHAKVIAKIERHEAMNNLEAIVKATDGIMVARGDLGVEIPLEQVPLAQNKMVFLSLKYGKPVIIATEMLQSMIDEPRATRAEISDAAHGVFQHADALMLSNETAIGKYPVQAVETLSKVSITIETEQKKTHHDKLNSGPYVPPEISCEITYLGAKLADELNARYLVAYTNTGYTAQQLAKQRIFTPIITITPSETVARQLILTWGLNEVIVKKINLKEEINELKKLLRNKLKVKKKDKIVIVSNSNTKERLITSIVI